MSDLHIEMERFRLGVPGWADFSARRRGIARHPARGPLLDGLGAVDLVVLAGDVHNGLRGVVYAEAVAAYLGAPVVLVAGNHEYYYQDMARLLPAFQTRNHKSSGLVHFLENQAARFTIRGERLTVLGCTLWTDYALHGDPQTAMREAGALMNDHRFIRLGQRPFKPADARALHVASLAWLRGQMPAGGSDKTMIVTHHAPSGQVLGTRTGNIAPAYGSALTAQFAHAPDLWVHGHTHHPHDSIIDGIRVVSAPRGYVGFDGDGALKFRPAIIEI